MQSMKSKDVMDWYLHTAVPASEDHIAMSHNDHRM